MDSCLLCIKIKTLTPPVYTAPVLNLGNFDSTRGFGFLRAGNGRLIFIFVTKKPQHRRYPIIGV